MAKRGADKNMELIKNKRGVFFIVMAIVIITLLLTSYTLYTKVQERKITKKRIETMNSFIMSIEQDLERKLFIAGFRSLFTFENRIIETGAYIPNVNASFQEMFFNGTFNNQSQSIMIGATFGELLKNMQDIGNKISITINITNPRANLDQSDPWNVRVTVSGDLTIRDNSNLSAWNAALTVIEKVPISYFDDPIYIINTGSLIVTKINQTNYSSFTAAELLDHTSKQFYKASSTAPSFIDRFEGNLNADSPNGIESLIDIPTLQNKGLQTTPKSIVDHIYFSSSNPDYCHVAGTPSWFYLDNSSLAWYNSTCG